MDEMAPAGRETDTSIAERLLWGTMIVVLAWFPLNREYEVAHFGGLNDLQHRVSLFLFDLPLVLLTFLALPVATRRVPDRKLPTSLFLLFALVGVTAAVSVFSPSPRGGQALLRLLCVACLVTAAVATEEPKTLRRFCIPIALAALVQAALSIAQVSRGETLGLVHIGEFPPLIPFDEEFAAKGTFAHPYPLAAFALVAGVIAGGFALHSRRRMLWAAVAGVVVVPVGLTYSRTGALAVVLCLTVLGLGALRRRRRGYLLLAAVIAIGVTVPAAATWGGWAAKSDTGVELQEDTTLGRADVFFSNRATQVKQAWEFISENPIVGVGPGMYVLELEEKLQVGRGTEVFPVHNVPLLITAENGVPAGLLFMALLVVLAVRAFRSSWVGSALFVAFLPFLMFDHFPYDTPQGLVLTGVWVAGVELLSARSIAPESVHAENRETAGAAGG